MKTLSVLLIFNLTIFFISAQQQDSIKNEIYKLNMWADLPITLGGSFSLKAVYGVGLELIISSTVPEEVVLIFTFSTTGIFCSSVLISFLEDVAQPLKSHRPKTGYIKK